MGKRPADDARPHPGDEIRRRLGQALSEQFPVRVSSHHCDDESHGFVVALGKRWAAIALLDEGRRHDGWDLVRLRDVSRVRRSRREKVAERILRARGTWPLLAPVGLDLDRASRLLGTLAARGDLVSIHCERERPDALWVGVPLAAEGRDVVVHELNTVGEWDNDPSYFTARDITRITVGDAYMEGLALVAPPRPPLTEHG
ncbi:hypothetical protein [Nocardioides yefusunii]|uniref:Uncharacterized protein n=1 Tax=Nocardioides yefusunii TaxID=2500546 RepID=A0ABW1QZ15_9ACTN|nr:hypothetical protein [Nocardioides yefusunii]